MKLKLFLGLGLLLAASVAHGQVATSRPASTSMLSSARLSLGVGGGYVMDSEAAALVLSLGSQLTPRHYVGFEGTWFKAEDDATSGGVFIEERLKTQLALAVYKFSVPLDARERFHAFAGVGVGASFMRLRAYAPAFDVSALDHSRWDRTGQIMAGFVTRVQDRLSLKVGYRHFRIYDVKLFGTYADFRDDVVEGAVVWRF